MVSAKAVSVGHIKIKVHNKKHKSKASQLSSEWACRVLIFHCCGELYVHNRLIAVGVSNLLWCHLHKSC